MTARSALRLLSLAAVLAGCDSVTPDAPNASGRSTEGSLRDVTFSTGSRAESAQARPAQSDFFFRIQRMEVGGTFGTAVLNGQGVTLLTLSQKSTPSGYVLSVDQAPYGGGHMDVLDGDRVVFSAPLESGGQPVGSAIGPPTSVHYPAPGMVVYDYSLTSTGTTGFTPARTSSPITATEVRVVFNRMDGDGATIRFTTPASATLQFVDAAS